MIKNLLLITFAVLFQQNIFAQENFGLIRDELLRKSESANIKDQNGSKSIYETGFHDAILVIEELAGNQDDESLMVFPNPAEKEIIIKVYDLYKGLVNVRLNTQGELKHEVTFDSADAIYRLSFKDLTAGTYWLDVIETEHKDLITHKYKIQYNP